MKNNDELEKGKKFSDEELELLKKHVEAVIFHDRQTDAFTKANNAEIDNEIEKVKKNAERNLKKTIDLLFKYEKGRSQSNQGNQSIQPLSPKSQNQPSNKNNYPWGIIIGMGAVIVALSGVIIFLLIKNKNKKRVK